MANEELKTFKISDQVKKSVDGPKRGENSASTVEPVSAGFPTLEALLENETPDLSGLQIRQEALLDLAKSGSTREKQGAKKAVVAYERALDVVDFLLTTKNELAES